MNAGMTLPCPFCRSPADASLTPAIGMFVVACTNPGCGGRMTGRSQLEAITRWNRRGDAKAQDAQRELLKLLAGVVGGWVVGMGRDGMTVDVVGHGNLPAMAIAERMNELLSKMGEG